MGLVGNLAEKTKSATGSMTNVVGGATKSVTGGIANAGKTVTGGVTNAGKSVGSGITSAGKTVTGGVASVGKTVTGGISESCDKLKTTVTRSKEKVKEEVETIKKKLKKEEKPLVEEKKELVLTPKDVKETRKIAAILVGSLFFMALVTWGISFWAIFKMVLFFGIFFGSSIKLFPEEASLLKLVLSGKVKQEEPKELVGKSVLVDVLSKPVPKPVKKTDDARIMTISQSQLKQEFVPANAEEPVKI